MKGRKRHLVVDTGKVWLLSHLFMAGRRLQGRREGQRLGREGFGWRVDVLVERQRKAAPEEVLKSWAEQWEKEGVEVDWEKLLPPKGFQVLPRRWVVQRTFSWIESQQET